jgi:hypothetical protein
MGREESFAKLMRNPFRSDLACQISLDAIETIMVDTNGRREIDIKRYARFEKVPLRLTPSPTVSLSSWK